MNKVSDLIYGEKMKQYIFVLLTLVFTTMFIGCQRDETISVTYEDDLSYASYFKDDNPIIKISVEDYGDMYLELLKRYRTHYSR